MDQTNQRKLNHQPNGPMKSKEAKTATKLTNQIKGKEISDQMDQINEPNIRRATRQPNK